jgi:hypothetical protein
MVWGFSGPMRKGQQPPRIVQDELWLASSRCCQWCRAGLIILAAGVSSAGPGTAPRNRQYVGRGPRARRPGAAPAVGYNTLAKALLR